MEEAPLDYTSIKSSGASFIVNETLSQLQILFNHGLYVVHISRILSDGQAHISRRDFLLAPKLCQPRGKHVFVHIVHHTIHRLYYYILSNTNIKTFDLFR